MWVVSISLLRRVLYRRHNAMNTIWKRSYDDHPCWRKEQNDFVRGNAAAQAHVRQHKGLTVTVASERNVRDLPHFAVHSIRANNKATAQTRAVIGNQCKLELAVREDQLQSVVDVILTRCRTGQIGDGKVFVSELEDVIRIRTGEAGEEAI